MTSQIEKRGLGIAIITAIHTAELAVAEYVKNPSDPERYLNHQEAHWAFIGDAMGIAKSDLVVADVPWTQDQMRQFMGKGLRLSLSKREIPFYLPQVVSGKDGLSLLGKASPWMRWSNEYLADIQNVDKDDNPVQLFGHLRTEAAIDAPFTKTNEDQAAAVLARLDRRGHTLNTYAEAGNQIKLLTGKYPDQDKTWIRLMSSRARGRVVPASFYPDGSCHVRWYLEPDDADGYLGVRSVGE